MSRPSHARSGPVVPVAPRVFGALDLQTLDQCPFFLQLRHSESLAGQLDLACLAFPQK